MGPDSRQGERGFSLIELMVAMVATLVVSGAVYGLLTAGNSAFRREPALADRQQNIRVALDIISKDVFRAGFGLPPFAQAFTDGLDALGPMGPGGVKADEIEVFAATDCPHLGVCLITPQGTGSSVTTFQALSACHRDHLPTYVILGDHEKWGLYWAEMPGAATSGACGPGAGTNGHVTLPRGQEPLVNPPGGLGTWVPNYMMLGQAIRYRITLDAEGTPNLERSDMGGRPLPDGSSSWQTIARGIEDLQVEYENGTDWDDTPGVISCGLSCAAPTTAEYDTLVRRVRIRLSARSTEAALQGQTTSAVGDAVRGQLVTDIAPRAANSTLGMAKGEI